MNTATNSFAAASSLTNEFVFSVPTNGLNLTKAMKLAWVIRKSKAGKKMSWSACLVAAHKVSKALQTGALEYKGDFLTVKIPNVDYKPTNWDGFVSHIGADSGKVFLQTIQKGFVRLSAKVLSK